MRPRHNRQGSTPSSWRPGHRREAARAPAGRLHWLSPSEQLSKARRCPALPPAWPWRISPLGIRRGITRWESHRSGGKKATSQHFRGRLQGRPAEDHRRERTTPAALHHRAARDQVFWVGFCAKADALHVADEWPIQQRTAIGFAQFTRSYSLTTALAPFTPRVWLT